MQKSSSLLIATLISITITALAGWSFAQPSPGSSTPTGSRLITLGTRAGPLPASAARSRPTC